MRPRWLEMVLKKRLSREDTEGQIGSATEKMAIFGDEALGTDPFGVGCDEGISWLKVAQFIFAAQLKWDDGIFVNVPQGLHDLEELVSGFWRQMPKHFLHDGARDANPIPWRPVDELLDEAGTRRAWEQP